MVSTGLAASAELAAVRRYKIPVLRKPFGPDALDTAVRQALGVAPARLPPEVVA